MSKIKLSQAFLVAASSLELLLFPFVGPLFIFTLYLIGALSFIFSISKTKLMFVLLTCLPMLFVFVEQNDVYYYNDEEMSVYYYPCGGS